MSRAAIMLLTLTLLAGCSPRPMPPHVIPPTAGEPSDPQGAKPGPARN